MIDRANDKRYDMNSIILILKKELEYIKGNWIVLLMCFFISRYSIIDKIFPFAIIVLCSFCYIKGPSLTVLAISLISILTVRFDFVYSVMLIAIFFFFYTFRNDVKKPATVVSSYAASVLLCSKTSILIVEGFNINGFMLNIFESIFIFSSIILVVELTKFIKNIKRNSIMEYMHRPKEKKSTEKQSIKKQPIEKIQTKGKQEKEIIQTHEKIEKEKAVAEIEAASTTTENSFNVKSKFHSRAREDAQNRKLLSIFTDKAKNKIKEQLLWENINVKYFEVIAGMGDSIFISLTVKSEKTPEKAEEAIIFTIRNICGVRLKCTEKIAATPNYYVLKFKNVKRVRIKTYVATAIKDGSPVSGDSYTYAGKADKYYAVLCDGIGSGEEAFSESNGAVGMLSRFLYTDFTEEQILKTLNSLLMLKLDDERYVTFDMQIIDYGSKEVRLYKAGTPPTYIMNGKTVEKIEGKSLPMGILEDFDYNIFIRTIKKDDMIVMISDGIIDSINMDDKKSLENYLELIMNKDPQTIANSILSYALRGRKDIIDDMTVLVTKII